MFKKNQVTSKMLKEKFRAIALRLYGKLPITFGQSFWTNVYKRNNIANLGKTTTKSLPWTDLELLVIKHMNSLYIRRLAGHAVGLTRHTASMDEVPIHFQENANRTIDEKGTTTVPIKKKFGDYRYVRLESIFVPYFF